MLTVNVFLFDNDKRKPCGDDLRLKLEVIPRVGEIINLGIAYCRTEWFKVFSVEHRFNLVSESQEQVIEISAHAVYPREKNINEWSSEYSKEGMIRRTIFEKGKQIIRIGNDESVAIDVVQIENEMLELQNEIKRLNSDID